MKTVAFLVLLMSVVRLANAQKVDDGSLQRSLLPESSITYTYDNSDFANPERGFMHYTITEASNYVLLDSAYLSNLKISYQAYMANYSVKVTTVFRYFVLDIFKSSPISVSFLANLEADFNTARKAGVKLIPRFTYTNTVNTGNCGSWICPPYGDAPKSVVLGHIAQLKSYFEDHEDVIMAIQMGFVGVWGEQYYTDYFGDASQGPDYSLTTTNWQDRIEVLDSLLSAVPIGINVQVRYPQKKQKAIYGVNAPTTSAPLSLSEAYTGSNKSRIGFHNDCFLANYDDYGTYADYSNGQSDTLNLKPYMEDDSKFVMVGGETCDSTGLWSLCDILGGNAIEDMNRMHFTYLNTDYNNQKVNNHWTTDGCIDEIKKKLGYRLYLTSGTYTSSVGQGNDFTYSIDIINEGFASPVNKRQVKLIMINDITEEHFIADLNHDPRYWTTGSHTITGTVCIPSCMQVGTYSLYLKISDYSSRLEDRPDYCIRLANTDMWIPSQGINDLNHTLTVMAGNDVCSNSQSKFESINKWIGPNVGGWVTNTANWSQGRLPSSCDVVVIGNGKTVYLNSGDQGYAHQVVLQDGGKLNIINGALLEVEE